MRSITGLKKPCYALITGIIIVLLNSSSGQAQSCMNYQVEYAAWGMTSRQAERMISDAELPANRNVSRREKIRRVNNHIDIFHGGSNLINNNDLAETIVDVAECTGHDFTFFSGIIKKESTYCLDRHNNGSGASGCGQFTSWPIRVFKNQLRLPHREENGDPDFKEAIEVLLSRCYEGRPEKIDQFIELFSQSRSSVKAFLRQGEDTEMDLVASAIYLKFYYARTGFYYNPHSSSPGALSLYGEGASYASQAIGTINQVNDTCRENENYLKEIENTSCELSNDPAACDLTTPTYDI